MAYSISSIPTTESDAFDDNKPFFVGLNMLDDLAEDMVWSTSGAFSDSRTSQTFNVDDTSFPTDVLFDRFGGLKTKPSALGGASTVYLLIHFDNPGTDDAHTFDVTALSVLNFSQLNGNITTTLEIADDEDFTTNLAVAAGYGSGFSNNSKEWHCDTNILTTQNRIQNLEYARVVITTSASSFLGEPELGELIIGKRRSLGHGPTLPHDNKGSRTRSADLEMENGDIIRHVKNKGRAIRNAKLRATDDGVLSVDEVQAIEDWFQDINEGDLNFLYVEEPNPSSGAPVCYWMRLERPELVLPQVGPFEHQTEIRMLEQPPYRSQVVEP